MDTNVWRYILLIDSGKYTESELLNQQKCATVKPTNSKILQGYINKFNNEQKLKQIIPDEIIMEEIFMHFDNSYLVQFWLINKKYNIYMNNNSYWERVYNTWYNNSGMKTRLPDYTFLQVFKICFNLKFIQITFGTNNPTTLLNLYNSTMLYIHGGMTRKFLYALQFMHNVTTINFHPNTFGNYFISSDLDKMPKLEKVIYNKKAT